MHIDWWTLALQAVNFLILIWLLARFFYRPVMDIVAKRRAAAQKIMDDANAARHGAEAQRAEIAKIRAGFAAEHQKILDDARAEAEEANKAMLAEAKKDAAKLLSDAKAAVARASDAAERALEKKGEQLGLAIAEKLLSRVPAQNATGVFLDGLCAKIRSLPPQSKAALKNGSGMEIVTAAALAPDEEARVRGALKDCLGTEPPLSFRADPAILAGIELSSRDMTLRNSWREDLRLIGEEMSRDAG